MSLCRRRRVCQFWSAVAVRRQSRKIGGGKNIFFKGSQTNFVLFSKFADDLFSPWYMFDRRFMYRLLYFVALMRLPRRDRRFSLVIITQMSLRHALLSGCWLHAPPNTRVKSHRFWDGSLPLTCVVSELRGIRNYSDVSPKSDVFGRTFCSYLKMRFHAVTILPLTFALK